MRVLIATVTAGGGHLAAAAALEEVWRVLRPGDILEKVDLIKFFSPLHRKIHEDGYLKLVERAPELWGMLFKKTDDPKRAQRLNKLKRVFPSNSRAKFTRQIKHFRPDVVLCTHYLPLDALAGLKDHRARHARQRSGDSCEGMPFVASIVTDFEAHALWMEECVDLYCVAAEETKARLVARGADPAKVLATGIPISTRFSATIDPKAVRKTLGIRDDLPVLLVLSGGFGMGPVAEIMDALDKTPGEFQTVVVTGRNEELRRALASGDRKHPSRVLGYASNMHELMAI
ncbi:MAG TPA: hypothetical protein VHH88_06800, partial [Verrucomicrobiae bacterium]|nr:hypothetical protein [Verrucomicrobiae bacterium]